MLPTKFEEITINLINLVITKLLKDYILGIYSHNELNMIIHAREKYLTILINNVFEQISYDLTTKEKKYNLDSIVKRTDDSLSQFSGSKWAKMTQMNYSLNLPLIVQII